MLSRSGLASSVNPNSVVAVCSWLSSSAENGARRNDNCCQVERASKENVAWGFPTPRERNVAAARLGETCLFWVIFFESVARRDGRTHHAGSRHRGNASIPGWYIALGQRKSPGAGSRPCVDGTHLDQVEAIGGAREPTTSLVDEKVRARYISQPVSPSRGSDASASR